MPGILYVIVITAVFTALLISFTAAFLLTQARAIVRRRYLGSLFSNNNVMKAAKVRPLQITLAGMLISVKDEETQRKLTTFKRPAELRLYQEFFYIRPFFSPSAYLIPLKKIRRVSMIKHTLVVSFEHEDREITLRCKSYNLARWFNALNRRISDHK